MTLVDIFGELIARLLSLRPRMGLLGITIRVKSRNDMYAVYRELNRNFMELERLPVIRPEPFVRAIWIMGIEVRIEEAGDAPDT